MKQYGALDDTFYMWFGANDTSGSGGDGASPAADVRLAGAAADAAPVYSPTPSLLSHVNYPAGAYEIVITASAANGFATGNIYAVFCTLAIDSQNPTGFVGSFDLKPVESNPTQIGDSAQSLTDLKDFADAGYDPNTNKITGTADMRGTDSAALAATALSDTIWTNTKAAFVDHSINTVDTNIDTLLTRLTAARAGYLDNLSAGAVALAAGVDLIKIHGVALTETVNGYLAAAFVKLFDVATPLLVASEVMRGTDSAALASALTTHDGKLDTVDTVVDGIQTDLSNATDGLGALKALIDTIDGIVDNILLDTGTNGVVVASGSKTGYALTAIGADLILKNSTFALAIADAVADEEYTGATHNIVNSLGRRVREIGAFAIHSGTAQAGATNNITLAATADANDGVYNRNLIVLVDNTGVSQTRTIVDYNGTTKIAIIDRDWRIPPDATTIYQITPDNTPLVVDQGVAQAGTSTTITLRSYASSINDNYLCNIVIIIAGTGRGQARLVGSYVGSTKVVTICGDNWITTPDNTSVYVMIPYGATCASCINDNALAQFNTEMDNVLNTAIPGSPTAHSINQRIKAIDELTEASGSGDLAAILVDTSTTIPGTISTLQTDSTAIKAKTDNLPSGITKNVALPKFTFYMVLSSDHVTGAAGKTIVGEISKDGSAFAAITNAITEVGDGLYVITSGFTQTEMNADVINLKFTETDCDQRTITIYTT